MPSRRRTRPVRVGRRSAPCAPPVLRPHQDPPDGSLECAGVEIGIETGDLFGEVRADAAPAEFVGEPVRTPPSIRRAKFDKTLGESLVIEKIEFVQPNHRAFDIIRGEALVAKLFDQLGAEVISSRHQLQSFVIRRIVHVNSR